MLVSKDINMRIKARALGPARRGLLQRQDARRRRPALHRRAAAAAPTSGTSTARRWRAGSRAASPTTGSAARSCRLLLINQFVYLEAPGAAPLYAKVIEITGKTAVLRTLKDYTHQKNAVWGVTARNREQNFALNLLMDPECDFITLTGTAGSGKTLMSLAAGLAQVMDDRRYTEIIVTRVTVPVGEDIGFLPGTEEEKMGPWMGALDDNLEVLVEDRQRRRRMGPRRDQRPGALEDQDQEPELHARPHLPQQVRHHRRGAEPDAQADEDADHARRPRHQDRLPRQPGADRHALPHRRQLGPHLCGRPLQGLGRTPAM